MSQARTEELMIAVIARMLSGLSHVAVGASSPIPGSAALLARELSRLCGLSLAERGLARRRNTPPQARSVDAEARKRNVADAFIADRRRVEGRRVLLIDDVMTTGATLDACARALREAGAASVWALTFARED